MAQTSIAAEVDDFFKASKSFGAAPSWEPGTTTGERRLTYPIVVENKLSDQTLVVTAYPFSPDTRFNLVLAWPPRIFGLDFEPNGKHPNPLDSPVQGMIEGPHVHFWSDNRHRATFSTLPAKIPSARPLQQQIRRLDQAFRWFCAQAAIQYEDKHVPEFPAMDRLL
jgi:hypothetical protein